MPIIYRNRLNNMKTLEVQEKAQNSLTTYHDELVNKSLSRWFFCGDLKQLYIARVEQELRNIILSDGTREEKEHAALLIMVQAKESPLIKLKMGFFSRDYNNTSTCAYKKLTALKNYLFHENVGSQRFTTRFFQRTAEIYDGKSVPGQAKLYYPNPKNSSYEERGSSDYHNSDHDPMIHDKYGIIRIV